MPEYIERDQVRDMLHREIDSWGSCADEIEALLNANEELFKIPAADVVAVKHGRWIGLEYDGYADGSPVYDLWECSECGEEVSGEDVPITHPYCHGCGAKMDGGENHE